MYDKYVLLKKWYPNHLIIFEKKEKIKTFDKDKIVYKYNKNLKLNYIKIIRNEIEISTKYNNNFLNLYRKCMLIDFFKNKRKNLVSRNLKIKKEKKYIVKGNFFYKKIEYRE